MRKLILFFLALGLPLSAAVTSGTIQWDVRTTGADTNGGGFDASVSSPGTDFSQQNAAQIAYTDLVVGVTTTQYTSVLHPVGSTLPGNILQVTGTVSGSCNTGVFEVLSNATITATVNASLGTAASVCTANLGGSFATLAQVFSVAAQYNGVNVKTGTYTQTSTLTVHSFTVTGFGSTHGDGGTPPLITTATNSTDLVDYPDSGGAPGDGGSTYLAWDNIQFSNTAATSAYGIVKTSANGPAMYVRNAKFTGFIIPIEGDNVGSHGFFQPLAVSNTEIAGGSNCTIGIINTTTTGSFGGIILGPGTFIHNCSAEGVYGNDNVPVYATGVVLDSNQICIVTSGGLVSFINSVCSNSAADGVNPGGSASFVSVNSIYYNNAAIALSVNAGPPAAPMMGYANNAFGSNGTNYTGPALPASATANDVALGGCNPFVSSTNFALSTCGKAALSGVGYPGATPAGTGSIAIGALNPAASATSGGPHAFVQ